MDKDKLTTVQHKVYGIGEVTKITAKKIYVDFCGKQRIFDYPDAFEKEYLEIVDTTKEIPETPHHSSGALTQEDIKHQILVVKINQRYEEKMDPDALYNAVRGVWKASKARVQKMDYVFGVYKGLIVAVYKPTEWFVCKEAPDRLPRLDVELSPRTENRVFFEDKSFEQGLPLDANQQFYLGKTIDNLKMNKNAQNPITYLMPEKGVTPVMQADGKREVILDASDIISYKTIYEALNATVGTDYTGWMKATWPSVYTSLPFRIWFPKLAETKNGKLVSAAFDCVNTISDDWNEVIFDDLKNGYVEGGEKYTGCTLIFAKEPQGGSYIFRGAYIDDEEKSSPNHYVSKRIGTKVKLTGQPSNAIEILDDFRKQ